MSRSRIAKIVIAISIFAVSLMLMPLAIRYSIIDRSEMEDDKTKIQILNSFPQYCDAENRLVGLRQICRKLLADALFRDEGASIDEKSKSIRDVLTISPSEPAYWVALAKIETYTFLDPKIITDYLRMSYLTGRSMQSIAEARFNVAVAYWGNLDETDKIIALNDLKIANANQIDRMVGTILRMNEVEIRDLLAMLRIRNPILETEIRSHLILLKK